MSVGDELNVLIDLVMLSVGSLPSSLKKNLYYYSHPTGTARLLVEEPERSVVDPTLRVQGTSNLRVLEARTARGIPMFPRCLYEPSQCATRASLGGR